MISFIKSMAWINSSDLVVAKEIRGLPSYHFKVRKLWDGNLEKKESEECIMCNLYTDMTLIIRKLPIYTRRQTTHEIIDIKFQGDLTLFRVGSSFTGFSGLYTLKGSQGWVSFVYSHRVI